MDELRELAYIINRHQVRYIDVLTNPDVKPAKTDRREWDLYVLIREGRLTTDEEIAAHFNMDPKGKQFNRLKNNLKRKMMDTVLFLEPNSSEPNDYAFHFQELVKEWVQLTMIVKRGGITTFIDNALKFLKKVMDFEATQLCVEICRDLSSIIATRPQYHKFLPHINQTLHEYIQRLNHEIAIQSDYNSLVASVTRKKGYKKEYAIECEKILEKYQDVVNNSPQPYFQTYYRIIKIFSTTFKHDWGTALELANQAIEYSATVKYMNKGFLNFLFMQRITALFMLGNYQKAKEYANESLLFYVSENANWFKTKELSVANAIYAEWYDEAFDTVQECLPHERFSSLSPIDQESWHLYHGYLMMLMSRKNRPASLKNKGNVEKFNLQHLLSELPFFSTDKRGSNIPVLLLQVHFLLIEGQHDLLSDRVEALRKYRQRNLDPNSEHYRTDLMIRLIELLAKHLYDLPVLHAESADLLERMRLAPSDILDRSFEIEIAPYPRQWAWMIEALSGN